MLIKLNNISKRYGSTEIFDKVNVSIFERDKIGVIGRNGAGKSTLCKIITDEEKPDSGIIDKSKNLRLSYLEQHDPFSQDETVLDFLVRYTNREEWKCGKIAGRFQIKNELLTSTPIGELSGGYQTRVKLTAMLLNDPNFLILDEPSNFLDLNTLILLEYFLQDYSGSFLIVSHDREFLKKTCRKTLEIENGGMTLFPGTVEEYLAYKEELIEQKTRYNINVEVKQKQLQAFVDRFRAKNTKSRQAQSKLKQLKKLKAIEIEHPVNTIRITLPQIEMRRGFAVTCSDLSIGYPDKIVAENINLQIDRGAHVAVLGDNGQGKTTFLKTLAGSLPEIRGEYCWSKHQDIAYFAQSVYANLDPDEDVLTYLQRNAAPAVLRQDILNIAGSFMFKGDDVFKPVNVLSDGERARLCLAGLLLSKKPALIMDEPTNHLDFETVEALGAALHDYKGTILFVSHDRTFVNMLATGIVDVKNGSIAHYPGTYKEYVFNLERQAQSDSASGDLTPQEKAKNAAKKKSAYHLKKELTSKISKIRKKAEKLEEEMNTFEAEKQATIKIFSLKPENYTGGLNLRYEELLQLIDERVTDWVELQEKIEDLRSRMP